MEFLTPKDFEDTNPLSTTSRRVFIKGLGFVSVSLLVSTMGGCDQLAEAIKNRPVRRRLRTESAEVDADINTYRNRSEEHTSELQSRRDLVCRLLLEKKNNLDT